MLEACQIMIQNGLNTLETNQFVF